MQFYNNIITSMHSENSDIQQEPSINRIYALPTEHEIITKTQLNEYQQIVTDRNQYQKHSQKSWYEIDKKTLKNTECVWRKQKNEPRSPINNDNNVNLLKRKLVEGQYFLDFPLNNRSFGIEINMLFTLSQNQYIEIYNRTNKDLNNKQGYKITLINHFEIQIRISVFKGNKFKLWRQVEIPSQSNSIELLIIDSGGHRSKIMINQYEIELPQLMPIFTDFFVHLKKSKNTSVQKIEIKYFDRLNGEKSIGYGCDCSNKCAIF